MRTKAIFTKIATELFDLAKDMGQLVSDIVFTPYGKLSIHNMHMSRATYYRKLKKFEQNGLIKKMRKPVGVVYILTEKAKQLRKRPTVKILRTDGFSSVVLFDIPEDKHKARDTVRRFLIRNGYTQIQKSVFISPFKVSQDFKNLVNELDLKPNVKLLEARLVS